MRNATGRREVAGGVIRNLHRMHIAYQHAVPGLGKSEGEELVTVIVLMRSWRCSSSTESRRTMH